METVVDDHRLVHLGTLGPYRLHQGVVGMLLPGEVDDGGRPAAGRGPAGVEGGLYLEGGELYAEVDVGVDAPREDVHAPRIDHAGGFCGACSGHGQRNDLAVPDPHVLLEGGIGGYHLASPYQQVKHRLLLKSGVGTDGGCVGGYARASSFFTTSSEDMI